MSWSDHVNFWTLKHNGFLWRLYYWCVAFFSFLFPWYLLFLFSTNHASAFGKGGGPDCFQFLTFLWHLFFISEWLANCNPCVDPAVRGVQMWRECMIRARDAHREKKRVNLPSSLDRLIWTARFFFSSISAHCGEERVHWFYCTFPPLAVRGGNKQSQKKKPAKKKHLKDPATQISQSQSSTKATEQKRFFRTFRISNVLN